MGPAQLTMVVALIVTNFKMSVAIKDTITLEECEADLYYCRNNYWRRKHGKLDGIVEWIGVITMPVLGGLEIVLGNEERELAAALLEAAKNNAQLEIVGGGRPIIPELSNAEAVVEVGVETPTLDVHVPTGTGPANERDFMNVLEGIINDFHEGGLHDIELPPRLNHFIRELDSRGEFFETLADDEDVFTPPSSMEGPTEIINGDFSDMPPMFLNRMMDKLLQIYRKFLQFRSEFVLLDEQLYTILTELADDSRVGVFYERMGQLTQEMKRTIKNMHYIMKSGLMRHYVRQVGSTFKVPKLPVKMSDRLLTDSDTDISSVSSESLPGSDGELDVDVGTSYGNKQSRESVIRSMPQDPNDPLEGGSRDVFVARGDGDQETGVSDTSASSSEREPEIPEGRESEYDDYDVEVKRRKVDSDADSDYDQSFFTAPDQGSDTDVESEAGSEHNSDSNQDSDKNAQRTEPKSGPSERDDSVSDSRERHSASKSQVKYACCSGSMHGHRIDNGGHMPPVSNQRRGQHQSGLFEHVSGPKPRLVRDLFKIETKLL